MEKNKTGKYLKYAIGEVFLVVIGILIALQINNWNENRKNTVLENEYYCRLYEDLLQDGAHIQDIIESLRERKTEANQLLRLVLEGNYGAQKLNLQYIKSIRGSFNNFIPNNVTYEDIKSGGNLNLIKDNNIKNLMDNYYKSIEPYIFTLQQYIDYSNDQYNRLSENHKQTGMIIAQITSDSVGVPGYKLEKDIIEKLQKYKVSVLPDQFHDTYFNMAYNMAANMERRMQLLENIKDQVEKTKSVLQAKCKEVTNQ